MKHRRKYLYSCLLAIAAATTSLISPAPALASSFAGTAANFAVLAGSKVTCTASAITGDVGVVLTGSATTGFTGTACTISGVVHAGDAAARRAYADFLGAYAALKAMPCAHSLSGTLSNVTLSVPGVYCFDAAATLTGTLTLQGPVNGVWLFKIGSGNAGGALTGTGFTVVMAGGAQPCNVNWWVADAATMTDSNFQGTILAGVDITLTRGTFNGDVWAGGRGTALAPTGAVTLTNGAAGPGAIVAGCNATATGVGPCRRGENCDAAHAGDEECSADDEQDGRHHGRGDH